MGDEVSQWKNEGPALDIVAAARLQLSAHLLRLQTEGSELRAQIAENRRDLTFMIGSIPSVIGAGGSEIKDDCSAI